MPGRKAAQRRNCTSISSSSSLSSAPDDSELDADATTNTTPIIQDSEEIHGPQRRRAIRSIAAAPSKHTLGLNALPISGLARKSTNKVTDFESHSDQSLVPGKPSEASTTNIKIGADLGVLEKASPPARRRNRQTAGPTGAGGFKKEEDDSQAVKQETTVTHTRKRKEGIDDERNGSPKRVRNKKQVKVEETTQVEDGTQQPKRRKRKTKEEKEAEEMPLASRAVGLKLHIGAHVSAAKGVHNAITNCVHIGGNAFALFLKSQRKWDNPPLQEEHVNQFKTFCSHHKYDAERHIVPHGSYLVNLAQEDTAKAKQAYESFLDDVKRCEALGIKLYNFHPGNTGPSPRPDAIARIASQLNRVHKNSSSVITLLETMAGGGNVIGSTFEDLRDIIALIDDKSRVGVCLDTCHIFAAGYELRDKVAFESTMSSFADIIGLKYLRAVHLNDSKAPFGSHRDLHANIGTGFLGLRSFHHIVNSPLFYNLPLVLETPISAKDSSGKEIEDKAIWAREIKTLESLVDMDINSKEFGAMEEELWKSGSSERARIQAQVDKKLEKDKTKVEKSAKGGKSKSAATSARKSTKGRKRGSDGELSDSDGSE